MDEKSGEQFALKHITKILQHMVTQQMILIYFH